MANLVSMVFFKVFGKAGSINMFQYPGYLGLFCNADFRSVHKNLGNHGPVSPSTPADPIYHQSIPITLYLLLTMVAKA